MKKLFSIFILIAIATLGVAQSTGTKQDLFNATNTYSLANLQAATAIKDTVTNNGTGALYSKIQNGDGYVTIQVTVTKVSGTVAGTMVLYGSLDGVLYDSIRTEETQTALATASLANATGTYIWRLKKSPYLYYQVGTSGGTTCVYYLTGKILKHGLGN